MRNPLSPRRSAAVVALSLVVAACASDVAAPAIPAAAFPGPSEVRTLDLDALVAEGTDPDGHSSALSDAGFGAGLERVWTPGLREDVRRVLVRALRFDDETGAAAYEAWLIGHPGELIGTSETLTPGGDVHVFVHHPSDCCPNKDQPNVLAIGVRGDVVWMVTAMGPGAEPADSLRILDAAMA